MSGNEIDLKALDRDLQKMPTPPKRGWWSRNWKRLLLLMLLLILAGVGYGGWYFYYRVLSNEAYQQAMKKIQENPEIIAGLGEPIKMVYMNPLPAMSQDNDNSKIKWSITGATQKQAKATLDTRLMNGKLETVKLEVEFPNGKKIPLNEDEGEGGAPIFQAPPAAPAGDANANPQGIPSEENMPEDLTPKIPAPEESK